MSEQARLAGSALPFALPAMRRPEGLTEDSANNSHKEIVRASVSYSRVVYASFKPGLFVMRLVLH